MFAFRAILRQRATWFVTARQMVATMNHFKNTTRAGCFSRKSLLICASFVVPLGCSNTPENSGTPAGLGGATTLGGSNAVGGSLGSGGSIVTRGGATANGGITASGGKSAGTTNVSNGGQLLNVGGNTPIGGANVIGGSASTGGSETGGTTAFGGASASGGKSAAGGRSASGGTTAIGGATALGGTTAAGGASASGGTTAVGGATASGPCDFYQSGNTPCVAAHSTVRALYGAYSGNLYQVRRASNNTTKDIGVLAPGDVANSAAQDTFCAGTTCTISKIYDQSPKANHLLVTPPGGWLSAGGKESNATDAKVKLKGRTVYGVYINAGNGYRNNQTTGIATADQPESMYMVASGKHYNDKCCFDYGNAETNSLDNGNGTMEAIYFGNCTSWGSGAGTGPWVMADLENGLFTGQNARLNAANTSVTSEYVTALIKGKPGKWGIKVGDSQAGALKTMYEGARPANGYDPMKKEVAIVLGTGGDNSWAAIGTFFEGVMTSGYPTDAVEDAVQANIVAAGYGK